MTDVPPESRPGQPPPPEHQPDVTHTHVLPPDRDPMAGKQRFSDRVWSLRAVIAIALASVILGGLAGAALASAGDDHDDRGTHFGRGGPVPPGMQRFHERRKEFMERRKEFMEGRGYGHREWAPGYPDGPSPSRPPRPTPSG